MSQTSGDPQQYGVHREIQIENSRATIISKGVHHNLVVGAHLAVQNLVLSFCPG